MATKITITISTLEEDETPEQSERRTKSTPGYAKAVREVMKTAEGRWGWCTATVLAKVGTCVGTAYLGNCSYKSAEDFALNSGYLNQMVEEAIKDAG
jgi:hypothetical protein